MELTFPYWWETTKNYCKSHYGDLKGFKWWKKVLIFIPFTADWIIAQTVISVAFALLFVFRELGKLLLFLGREGIKAIGEHPIAAVSGGVIIGLVLTSVWIYNGGISTFGAEPVVITNEVPTNIRGPKKKTLAEVQKDWNNLYKNEREFRVIADKIESNLGIDGRKFFAGLDFHESVGNGYVIGDKGLHKKAYGRIQIRQMALDDLQDLGHYRNLDDIVGDRPEDLLNCAKAFDLYVSRYLLVGEKDELNAYLNTWNGGPSGTPADTDYTHKVRNILGKIKD